MNDAFELSTNEPYVSLPEPERRLLLAIIEDAATCYLRGKPGAGAGTSGEAERWIWGRGRPSVLSFQMICETLGFDTQSIRRGLMRLKESGRSHAAERPPFTRKPYRVSGHAA